MVVHTYSVVRVTKDGLPEAVIASGVTRADANRAVDSNVAGNFRAVIEECEHVPEIVIEVEDGEAFAYARTDSSGRAIGLSWGPDGKAEWLEDGYPLKGSPPAWASQAERAQERFLALRGQRGGLRLDARIASNRGPTEVHGECSRCHKPTGAATGRNLEDGKEVCDSCKPITEPDCRKLSSAARAEREAFRRTTEEPSAPGPAKHRAAFARGSGPLDVWGKLWDLATTFGGSPATIDVHPDDAGTVTLTWDDGSCGEWTWDNGEWVTRRVGMGGSPCDVAARDSA